MGSTGTDEPSVRHCDSRTEPTLPTRVLIADNTQVGRELLRSALARHHRFELYCSDNKATEVISVARESCSDVIILNASPDVDALKNIRAISSALPLTPIVILYDKCVTTEAIEAFRAGVRGIFRRTDSLANLVKCINAVRNGQVWATSADLTAVLKAFSTGVSFSVAKSNGESLLTPREQQVTELVAEGLTNQEIGQKLNISEHTVKNYLFRIYDKLGISTRVELILRAATRPQASG